MSSFKFLSDSTGRILQLCDEMWYRGPMRGNWSRSQKCLLGHAHSNTCRNRITVTSVNWSVGNFQAYSHHARYGRSTKVPWKILVMLCHRVCSFLACCVCCGNNPRRNQNSKIPLLFLGTFQQKLSRTISSSSTAESGRRRSDRRQTVKRSLVADDEFYIQRTTSFCYSLK